MENTKTYPYTHDQLRHFKMEIEEAGGVDELMIKKEALKQDGETIRIVSYKDIEAYRKKYLVGVYSSLQTNYNTTVPYVFWGKLYEMLKYV